MKNNKIDTTLVDKLKVLAKQDKKLKGYKRRLRVKGKIVSKSLTKNKNINFTIMKDEENYSFIVLKTHKESYALAERLQIGRSVSIEGIPKFRMTICTRLKALEKRVDGERQEKLGVL